MGEGGVLSTDLFFKPTDTHQYLHKKSCHPWHTKKAIPYGQALRFRRICSEDRQFQERVGELAGWLKDRGYEESLVNEQIDRVRRLDRTALLKYIYILYIYKIEERGGKKCTNTTSIPASLLYLKHKRNFDLTEDISTD